MGRAKKLSDRIAKLAKTKRSRRYGNVKFNVKRIGFRNDAVIHPKRAVSLSVRG